MSFISFLSMFRTRAAAYVICAFLFVFALIAWHKTAVKRAVEAERNSVTLSFENAKIEAIKAAIANADDAIITAKIESEKQNAKIKQDAASIIARHNAGTGRLSVPPVAQAPLQTALERIPPHLLEKREPNFLTNLSIFLSPKPSEQMK